MQDEQMGPYQASTSAHQSNHSEKRQPAETIAAHLSDEGFIPEKEPLEPKQQT